MEQGQEVTRRTFVSTVGAAGAGAILAAGSTANAAEATVKADEA